MQHFYRFWAQHCAPVGEAAAGYLRQYHRIRRYTRDEVIKFTVDDFPFLCIVLDGAVGGYQNNRAGKRVMRELALPMDFFTGTQHAFSSRGQPLEFVALKRTRLLLIPLDRAREGQQLHQEVSELFHVLKQRKILRLRKLVEIYLETELYERYVLFREQLPEIANSSFTTNLIHAQLLLMSVGHLKKLKKRYFGKS